MVAWFNPNHGTEFSNVGLFFGPSLRIVSWLNLYPLMTVLKVVKKKKG